MDPRGVELEGDEKHVKILQKEWAMDQCSEVDTPITKNGQDNLNNGEELHEEEARRARRAIARINYMAQDRPDISVAARVLSQCMAGPREGVLPAIKRVIRYLRRYPRCIIEIDSDQQVTELDVWTDSDWAVVFNWELPRFTTGQNFSRMWHYPAERLS